VSKKIQIDQAPIVRGSRYPTPYDAPCHQRVRQRLGDAAGLSQFGVNLTRLPPGTWSSQRHWHGLEDEFIYVLEGELLLVTDQGEELLRAGDCAGFKAGVGDGHHLRNQGTRDAVFLEIGTRSPRADAETVDYPDIDLKLRAGRFVHRDGVPYENA
jgi:uncharacterized cupin superfamily protein